MPISEVNFRWKMKVQALTLDVPWTPKVGDCCTEFGSDIDLYRVEEIGSDGTTLRPVFEPNATESVGLVLPELRTDRTVPSWVWVPDFILGTGERDRPRIEAEKARAKPAKPKAGKAAGKDS